MNDQSYTYVYKTINFKIIIVVSGTYPVCMCVSFIYLQDKTSIHYRTRRTDQSFFNYDEHSRTYFLTLGTLDYKVSINRRVT